MKRMNKFYAWMLGLVSVFAFTACDDDVDRAMALSGDWTGYYGSWYAYDYGHGDIVEYDSYKSDVVFYPDYDYATHGYGIQLDYYRTGPYRQQYFRFYWDVKGRDIYLTYPHNHDLDTVIYDYTLSNYHFTGYFGDSDDFFDMTKITSYYDWSPYYDDWGYWYYDDWYYGYAKTRSLNKDSVEIPLKPEEGKIVKYGHRIKK